MYLLCRTSCICHVSPMRKSACTNLPFLLTKLFRMTSEGRGRREIGGETGKAETHFKEMKINVLIIHFNWIY